MASKLLSVEEEWANFKSTHNKTYESPEEEESRFKIFQENYQKIKEHNEKFESGAEPYAMGIHEYSDKTQKELMKALQRGPGMLGMAAAPR